MDYAKDAAKFTTEYKLQFQEFAKDHRGKPDIAVFDFTSMFAAENACCVKERNGHRLLMGLVGDSLLEVCHSFIVTWCWFAFIFIESVLINISSKKSSY